GTPLPQSVDLDGGEAMCPSADCPYPLASCPTSTFPCDIDLANDPKNCGSCGFHCPTDGWRTLLQCLEGKCVYGASHRYKNRNGSAEEGCEYLKQYEQGDPTACTDATSVLLSCRPEELCTTDGKCVSKICREGLTQCDLQKCSITCANLESDPLNCGACGNPC